MRVRRDDITLSLTTDGKRAAMTLITDDIAAAKQAYEDVRGHDAAVTVKRYHPRRSLSANAYLWVLCGSLADRLGVSKDDIYREAVKKAGACDLMRILNRSLPEFERRWNAGGLGCGVEIIGEGMYYSDIICYHGSSSYNTAEMTRLINYVVDEAKEQGIETATPDELQKMIALYNDDRGNRKV